MRSASMMRAHAVLLALCLSFATMLGWSASAQATGEGCSVFAPCASGNDYCRFVDIFTSICTERGDSRERCSGIGQGTCKPGLVCDITGECRHEPGQLGELCGVGIPCAGDLACSADVGGRCQARGIAGASCSGTGQGSCASGLVCDARRICRHDPPVVGEPCGLGVDCADPANAYCSDPAVGTCLARGDGREACTGLGQGTCKAGLACDVRGECRHQPGELGEYCGTGVPCVASLGCSAEVGGRCDERDQAGEVCSGLGQGSCADGLVCDANRTCRHDPPITGEPCALVVPCGDGSVCSADIGGTCGARRQAGESCSGILQGSCEDGLVCDGLRRICRHDPPILGENCGPLVPCGEGLGCHGFTNVCVVGKTVGEGCSAVNPCSGGLSCEVCFAGACRFPFQCFPNANEGPLSEAKCRALYSPALQQAAKDLRGALNFATGTAQSAGVALTNEIGTVYGPDGRYGCFTTTCFGTIVDISVSAYVQAGLYTSYDKFAGASTSFVQSAGAGVGSFSTSQVFERLSLDVLDIGQLIGTEDSIAAGISPDDVVIPLTAGVFACQTDVDTLRICGNGIVETGESCDDGNTLGGDACPADCKNAALCGNGTKDAGEACDDGNTTAGDGCSASCAIEPRCGDGALSEGEACDDGNTASGDGCSASCAIEPRCGNGLTETGEACDDGNQSDGDGCSATCVAERPCGDGSFDTGRGCRNDPARQVPVWLLDLLLGRATSDDEPWLSMVAPR